MTRNKARLERSIEELINLVTKMYWIPAVLLQSSQECPPPGSLQPLLSLIDSLTTLAFLAGVGIGVLGFSAAAIMIMMPGEEWTRRGKKLARHAFVGVILLLAAPMIVDYLTTTLGEEAFCPSEPQPEES